MVKWISQRSSEPLLRVRVLLGTPHFFAMNHYGLGPKGASPAGYTIESILNYPCMNIYHRSH